MKKRKYTAPLLELCPMDQPLLNTMSGGGDDNGNGTAESKKSGNVSFSIWDDADNELDE